MPYNNLRWLDLLYCVSYQSQAKIFTQSLGRKRRKDRNIAVLASQRQILLLTMVNQLNIHPQALTHGSEFHTAEVTVTNNNMVMSVTLLKPFSIPPLLHSFSAFAQSPSNPWHSFFSSSLLMADNQQLTCGHFYVAFCLTDFILEEIIK